MFAVVSDTSFSQMQERIQSGQIWNPKLPLAAVTLTFSVGIVLQFLEEWPLFPVWIALLLMTLLWMTLSWKRLPPPWPMLPLVLIAGGVVMWRQQIAIRGVEPDHLARLVIRLPQHVALRGVIQSDPVEHPVLHERLKKGAASTNLDFEMRVTGVRFTTAWQAATGSVEVRLPIPHEGVEKGRIEFGQEVELEGVLKEPLSNRNFGLFDYALYLKRQGILHLLQAEQITVLGPASGWKWIFDVRQYLGQRLTLGIEQDTLASGIIRGMLLGYREDIPPDVNRSFRLTGTLHVFAISGSHISLIALALLVVLRLLRVPTAIACALVLPLLGFYVVATGLRASAIRSLIMAGVVLFGWSIRRPSALLNNLAASAMIILAWDPFQLFDPGFQLSFIVVAALVAVSPTIESRLRVFTEPDPFIPHTLVPRWRKRSALILGWCAGLFSVSLAAWMGSIGLNIYYFNLISWIALPANLLIVPLASASVGLGLISLVAGWIWSELAITLNTTHALIIHLMMGISEKLSTLKSGYVYVPQPAPGWIVLGYAIGIACFLLWTRDRKPLALTLGAGSLIGLFTLLGVQYTSRDLWIDGMDVGAGQAVLITGPRFERILIDAGSRTLGTHVVGPFLRSRGVNRLDTVILSGGDAGHYGGMETLLEEFPISKVVVPAATFRSRGYRQLLEQVRHSGIPVQECAAGDILPFRSGDCHVIWPPKNSSAKRADDQSMVMEWNHGGQRILFAGDTGVSVESELTESIQVPCTLLIQGLHSSEESLSEEFLKHLHPSWILLNTSEFPHNASPSPELQNRLQQSRAHLHRTDESGGAIFRIREKGLLFQPFRDDQNRR